VNQSKRSSHLLSGLAGGLLVLVAGLVLVLTGVVDTSDDDTAAPAAQAITQPVADSGGDGPTINEIYDRSRGGVVFVEAEGGGGGQAQSPFGLPPEGNGTASGSGFVLDDEGYVITNAHVVQGADDVTLTFPNEDQVGAEIVGADLSSDVAVLKVDPGEVDLQPIPLADSSEVEVGDPTVAIGNPFGLDSTVTTGIVSAIQRQITAPNGFSIDNVIQTDASINPGNSGGPLLDARGRVIGINSQIATGGSSGGSVGIGFAVPVNTAKEVIPQLKEDGEVERAFLGVTTTDLTEEIASDANFPVDEGALVQDVVPDGPSDEAGLEAGDTETAEGVVLGGDIIVSVDGDEVTESLDVAEAIADNAPGDAIEIEYYRGDELETTEVELGERPTRVGGGNAPTPPGGGGGGGLPFPLP
jgi:S1-C subfamily serine protease